jgi:NAD(P)-dependent dehydrogenase (short-subunit alcohol dehydrogenase family)
MRLQGKTAIVTGGGSGIGRASVLRFAEEGAAVGILGVDEQASEETAAMARARGGRVSVQVADIAATQQVERAVQSIQSDLGPINILYNNAGIGSGTSAADTTDEELERVLSVNVSGMFRMCRAVLPSMIERRSGVILNNASITAFVGAPGMAAYAASKGAIVSFTHTLALEQAENGIRVNCICPASIDTPLLQGSFDRTPDPAAARARNIQRHPLGRLGTPEDVANLALFLVSNEASFITGSSYVVDGGALIARRWQD